MPSRLSIRRLVPLAGLLAIVHLSLSAKAQEWSPPDDSDAASYSDAVEVEKKPGGRLNMVDFSGLEKRAGARAFSSFQPNQDNLRDKRPGGRFSPALERHELRKRPGARFILPSGGYGSGGMVKRPGGRYLFGDRSKRPGGRYFRYGDDMMKRLGGRYFGGDGGASRWKRAGGRHIGSAYYSFYGGKGIRGPNRGYRSQWGQSV